jgi:hypothetical protein
MTAQKAQADVLLHRLLSHLHYALPWADGDFDADRGFGLDEVGHALGQFEPGARSQRGGGGGCPRALAV